MNNSFIKNTKHIRQKILNINIINTSAKLQESTPAITTGASPLTENPNPCVGDLTNLTGLGADHWCLAEKTATGPSLLKISSTLCCEKSGGVNVNCTFVDAEKI